LLHIPVSMAQGHGDARVQRARHFKVDASIITVIL
jgi:hypothetical protein